MIKTKADLIQFLAADREALGKTGRPRLLGDVVWRFEIILRKHEYFEYQSGLINGICRRYYAYRHHRLGLKLGFDVPTRVFGPGLHIKHHGSLVVSENARVGRNCELHQGVHIGVDDERTVLIGNDCKIGPGAKLIDHVTLGNDVAVEANALVNHPFLHDHVTIGGTPATIIDHQWGAKVVTM